MRRAARSHRCAEAETCFIGYASQIAKDYKNAIIIAQEKTRENIGSRISDTSPGAVPEMWKCAKGFLNILQMFIDSFPTG